MKQRRATVWHCQYKADAYERANRIGVGLDPKVTGEPGNWKVTRLMKSGESPKSVYRGRVA